MKSSRILFVFGGIPLSASEHTAKTWLSVYFGSLEIYRYYVTTYRLDAILFSPEKYQRNLLAEEVSVYVFVSCA